MLIGSSRWGSCAAELLRSALALDCSGADELAAPLLPTMTESIVEVLGKLRSVGIVFDDVALR